jgi:tripartite-type tricarboxylate transporter receptor subunit TctC
MKFRWRIAAKHAFMRTVAVAAFAATAIAVSTIAATTSALAQSYPTKPIKFIATEVPGSATDIQARIIARGMSGELGQPIEIENLFGEAGLKKGIASAPDGYTIVYGGSGTLALLPHIQKVSFDPLHDLTPVGRFVVSPTLLAVTPSLPAKNVQELVALIKANPGKLKMSTAGAGTAGHFAGELLIAMAGLQGMTQVVHYPGGGPAIDAVANGDAQWTLAPIAGRLPLVRTGKLRALASGGTARLPMLPDVPTVAESGYQSYSAVGWSGIYVPVGTPQPIIDKLNAAIAKAVTLPDVKKQFEAQGVEGMSSTQAQVAEMLKEDYVRLGDLAKSIGVAAQ